MPETLYTVEDVYEMDGEFELDEGRLVPIMPGSAGHGELLVNIGARLREFVRPRRLGKVYGDTGFVLNRGPDTMRGPDVAFVRFDHVQSASPGKFHEGCPDLAIEVVASDSAMYEAIRKTSQYLSSGCPLVWIFQIKHERVMVYSMDGTVTTLTRDDILDGGNVLPGLSWSVAAVYDDTD